MAVKKDNFLSDLGSNGTKPGRPGLSMTDGFRFGFGFTIGFLFVALILSGLTWGIFLGLHH
jgi:hypothetical protein